MPATPLHIRNNWKNAAAGQTITDGPSSGGTITFSRGYVYGIFESTQQFSTSNAAASGFVHTFDAAPTAISAIHAGFYHSTSFKPSGQTILWKLLDAAGVMRAQLAILYNDLTQNPGTITATLTTDLDSTGVAETEAIYANTAAAINVEFCIVWNPVTHTVNVSFGREQQEAPAHIADELKQRHHWIAAGRTMSLSYSGTIAKMEYVYPTGNASNVFMPWYHFVEDPWVSIGDSIDVGRTGWSGNTHTGTAYSGLAIPLIGLGFNGRKLIENTGLEDGVYENDAWKHQTYERGLKKVVFQIGTNDYSTSGPSIAQATMLAAYEAILDDLAANGCSVIVMSVPPRGIAASGKRVAGTITAVLATNAALLAKCKQHGFVFLDQYQVFRADGEDYYGATYSTDGVHPTVDAAGYGRGVSALIQAMAGYSTVNGVYSDNADLTKLNLKAFENWSVAADKTVQLQHFNANEKTVTNAGTVKFVGGGNVTIPTAALDINGGTVAFGSCNMGLTGELDLTSAAAVTNTSGFIQGGTVSNLGATEITPIKTAGTTISDNNNDGTTNITTGNPIPGSGMMMGCGV